MARRGKKLAVEGYVLDRISHLPSDVISQILDLLPFKEIAKTSVLSRNWRYIWASHPNIKIDFESLEINNRKNSSDIINKILLQHNGPVLKCSLVMDPPNDFDYSFVDHWLLYLSKNGIKELTLSFSNDNPGKYCTLPSHIFSAPELVVLNLTHIIFKPPNGHSYFLKLTILNFSEIDFGLYKLKYVVNTPQLTHLTFICCSGICQFKICALNLKTVSTDESADVELNSFEMPEITTLALAELDSNKMSLTKLFEKWRLISWFYVSGNSFENLVTDNTRLERLPIMSRCLKTLGIEVIDLSDLHQISCMLYLLKNSNALSRLEILVSDMTGWDTSDRTLSAVSNYLDAPQNLNWMADSLEVVVVDGNFGLNVIKLCIIKFLLTRAPNLKRMFVKSFLNDKMNKKLSKRLMQYPRASMEAEIICEENVPFARIPKVYSLS